MLDVDEVLVQEPETVVPSRPPIAPIHAEPTIVDRARAYLAKCAPAISGSNGSGATLTAATAMVIGFLLDEDTAYALLSEWNLTCQPPWSEKDLRRKIREAAKRSTRAPGGLLHQERRRA
jgi:hypothetical protein